MVSISKTVDAFDLDVVSGNSDVREFRRGCVRVWVSAKVGAWLRVSAKDGRADIIMVFGYGSACGYGCRLTGCMWLRWACGYGFRLKIGVWVRVYALCKLVGTNFGFGGACAFGGRVGTGFG